MKPPRVAITPPTARMTKAVTTVAALGLGPEALPLDDQERQDAGTDDEGHDVGRVQEMQGQRGDKQQHGNQPGAALPAEDARGRA